eukprot:15361812-Ditylum_brightwellii.AAC.1
MDKHAWTGIFLGYDAISDCVKSASHVKFNKGMNILASPPPHTRQLQQTLVHNFPAEDFTDDTPRELQFEAQYFPFPEPHQLTFTIKCTHDTLGFSIAHCPSRNRAYLADIVPATSAATLKYWKRKYADSYI